VKACAAAIIGLVASIGCAVGDSDSIAEGEANAADAAASPTDSYESPFADGGGPADGRVDGIPQVLPDAGLPAFPDAALPAADGGLLPGMCATTADCPTNQCCFTVFALCIDGQEVPVFGCLPN